MLLFIVHEASLEDLTKGCKFVVSGSHMGHQYIATTPNEDRVLQLPQASLLYTAEPINRHSLIIGTRYLGNSLIITSSLQPPNHQPHTTQPDSFRTPYIFSP